MRPDTPAPATADIAVVGAGVVGAAIAYETARRRPDLRVLLVDTHRPVIGATAYSAGILRRHHTFLPDAELADRSLSVYREMGDAAGYRPLGFLLLLPGEFVPRLERNLAASGTLRAASQVLGAAELRARYGALSVSDDEVGVLEHDGGYGAPATAAATFRERAVRAGARWMPGRRVDALERTGDRWRLHTNLGAVEADQVVLATGAATRGLGETAGIEIPLTPRRIGLVTVEPAGRAHDGLPVVIDDVTGTYFVPQPGGEVALGVRARPEDERVIPAAPLDGDEVGEAIARAARRVAAFGGCVVTGSQAASDGYTPDGRPLLGPVEGAPGLQLACGFSGGGFKSAPAVASLLAESLTSGVVPDLLRHYLPDRYHHGRECRGQDSYTHL
ncbi:FAD-binding oxidoreductase [Myceligenerans crystallogenes]|uniref:FAD-dependent oxidoreductase n=1 Tax=Myceligenerans crystallogenes TaxID=316335 RepID=A0ABN2NA09_9MICO